MEQRAELPASQLAIVRVAAGRMAQRTFDIIFALTFFLRLGTAGLTAQSIGARDADDGLVHLVRACLIGFVEDLIQGFRGPDEEGVRDCRLDDR